MGPISWEGCKLIIIHYKKFDIWRHNLVGVKKFATIGYISPRLF